MTQEKLKLAIQTNDLIVLMKRIVEHIDNNSQINDKDCKIRVKIFEVSDVNKEIESEYQLENFEIPKINKEDDNNPYNLVRKEIEDIIEKLEFKFKLM